MGISENNKKYLRGLTIHRPTLHELMERQLREMNNQQQFMEDNGLSYIDLQKLLKCGCQLVTIENNKITLVDPKRKPIPNAKQYLMHIDLGHEPAVIDPRTIYGDDVIHEFVNKVLSHTDPDDPLNPDNEYRTFAEVDNSTTLISEETAHKLAEEIASMGPIEIKETDIPLNKYNETTIDDGNGNPLFNVIDYECGNVSVQETMEKWVSGIKSNNTKVKYDHYNDDDETGFVFPIVSKCEIVGNGPSPFEACAKSMYELIKDKDVVIIQSIFGFGGSDVPFSLFLKNDHGYITAIWLDADWEYYSIKRDDDKHVWRPCWDSYFNDKHERIDLIGNGSERFCHMMDRVMYEIAKENGTTMDDPSLTAIDFYQYLMCSEPYCEFECTLNNFENELCEYLKTEYMFTLEQWLKDNPDSTPEDALGTYEFDEPNEEYDCSYYVIYEHTYKSK